MIITTSFDSKIAKKVGIECAIIYAWLLEQNRIMFAKLAVSSSGENTAIVNISYDLIEMLFPFMKIPIKTIIDRLIKESFINAVNDINDTINITVISDDEKRLCTIKKKKNNIIGQTDGTYKEFLKTQPDGSKTKVETTVGKLVNEMIDMFKTVNPQYEQFYSRNVQRQALEHMIDTYPIDSLFMMLNTIPQTNKIMYAPTITTPLEFERLAPKLIAFIQKYKSEKENKEFKFVL